MHQVKNLQELKEIIINKEIPLNEVDISLLTSLSFAFSGVKEINGSISDWNTSNITDMEWVFNNSEINPDISKWDVSKVTSMEYMFERSSFNGNISDWDVSSVKNMKCMFQESKFNSDISKWDVSSLEDAKQMFNESIFNKDIYFWNVCNLKNVHYMFQNSKFGEEKVDELFSSKYNESLGAWNLLEAPNVKGLDSMFLGGKYHLGKWKKDRVEHLNNSILEIEKQDQIMANKEKKELKKALNKNPELTEIEFEF